jgi:hypothetical protein
VNKTLSTATLAVLALLAGGTALAQADTAPAGRTADMSRTQLVSRLDAQFATLDANRDGFLSDAERSAVRDARIEKRFAQLDTDRNGSVTLAEMKAQGDRRGEASAERSGRRGHHGKHPGMRAGGRGHGGMHLDANKDGRISKAEFQAPALERFDRMDADRNGVVTTAEHQAARAAMKGARGR